MASPMRNRRNIFHSEKEDKNVIKDVDSGRKGRVEHHVLGYYRRVHDALQDGFEEDEQREGFFQNVFKQTEEQEVKLCQNQTISRILEEILPMGNSTQIFIFFKGLLSDVETVMYDRFGAHVLQTTLSLALQFIAKKEKTEAYSALILTLSQMIVNQLESVAFDTYASHVLRTLLQVLGGLQVAERITRSKLSREQQQRDLLEETKVVLDARPEEFINELKSLKNGLMKSNQVEDFIYSPSASPVLAVLLLVLQKTDQELCMKTCRKLIKKCGLKEYNGEAKSSLPEVLTDPTSSHLLETIFDVASEDLIKELLVSSFHGNLLKLAKSPVANFVLQRLIARMGKIGQLDQMVSELGEGFESILAVNHTGVLLQLSEACYLCPANQETFLEYVLRALHCYEPEERQAKCIVLIASLEKYEDLFPEEDEDEKKQDQQSGFSQVKLHGSLLLQNLLKFQNKRIVVNGFLSLTSSDLKTIACQPAGSYLLEHFMAVERIKDKKKEQLLTTMKEHLHAICCNKNGSRAMESIFKMSSMKIKTLIASELSKRETQLHSDRFGSYVHRTCQLSQFRHRRDAWTSFMNKDDKKRKLFADVIGEEVKSSSPGESSKRQKKRKRKE
ncbi:Nucleolar protein 9 [Holothuria leucospilota]|uniref:Nucleolar protein 9 n=1 Tax=Holothuria leucospilota TaxID=206669 RepID=A0A9Q1CA39_HOLLE|nr:Nucleolar protein 9 [Holothuria leucospilota]